MPNEVEIQITSDPRWLGLLRRVVDEFANHAGFEAKDRHALLVAVSEAVSNVMKHSYHGDSDRKLSLACQVVDGEIEICIKDDGEAFDPKAKELLPPEEVRPGGRGVYLMKEIMDEVEYWRDGATNCVRMKKYVRSPAER